MPVFKIEETCEIIQGFITNTYLVAADSKEEAMEAVADGEFYEIETEYDIQDATVLHRNLVN